MLKKAVFSPAQPWRAETRLIPSKAAASEEAEVEVKVEQRSDFFSILFGLRSCVEE